jgi:hypothetical protein
MKKPTKEEWVKWATDNKLADGVLEYVQANPHTIEWVEAHTKAHEQAAKAFVNKLNEEK